MIHRKQCKGYFKGSYVEKLTRAVKKIIVEKTTKGIVKQATKVASNIAYNVVPEPIADAAKKISKPVLNGAKKS